MRHIWQSTHKKDTATVSVIKPVMSINLSEGQSVKSKEEKLGAPLPGLQAAVFADVQRTEADESRDDLSRPVHEDYARVSLI